MKKLLIIGASILQLPAIKRAKELGFYTIVADYDPNSIGIPYADEYHNVSTIDVEGVRKLALELKPDGVMTLATDMPMRSVAAATTALGLPGITPDTAVKATDKGEMIKAFEANNVEIPWYYIIKKRENLNAVMHKITYPCVIKPTDNAGNRGVCYVENEAELVEKYNYSFTNSRSGDVIIEEYMSGQEVSVEIIVLDNKVHVLAVTDKLTEGAPYFVEIGHCEQSQLPLESVVAIKDLASRAVLALGINNSPAHVEIMLTEDGPKMVELGARMGGGCITTHLVPLSTGIDMVEAVVKLSLGEIPNLTPKFNRGSAIRHITNLKGVITSIEGLEDAKATTGVKEVTMLKNIGDEVHEFLNGADRIGYVIADGATAQEAIDICNKALNKIKINFV